MASLQLKKNKLYITHSCGVLAVFGIPLAVMGLVILQVSTASVAVYSLAALIILLGLVISTGHRGIIIDYESSQMITWYGLWMPFFRNYESLNGYDKVVLSQQRQSVNKDSTIIYPVQLRSNQTHSNLLSIYESTDLLESKALAEHISAYIGKPLENSSSGELLVCQPNRNKKKLTHKANIEKNINPLLNNQILVTKTIAGVEISLRPRGLLNAYLMFLPHCIAAIVIGIFIIGNVDAEIIQQSMSMVAILVFLAILALVYFALKIGKSVTKILIDNKTIKVYQQTPLTQSEQVLQINELEELFISELTFSLFPIFTGNILSLVTPTQTIEVTGIKSTKAVYQLKAIISESIG